MIMNKTKRIDLPYNEEAERTVIGSVLCSKDALYKVLSILHEDDFYIAKNIYVYRAILSAHTKRLNIDILVITEELLLMNVLDNVGGVEYLKECCDCYISLATLDTYINIVKDNSDLRKFLVAIREIDDDFKQEKIESIESFIKASQEKIRTCIVQSRTGNFKELKNYNIEALDEISSQKTSGDKYNTGITCGYENINKFTNGFHRGEVTILGARSGVGKTALALNMAYRAASRSNVPVAIFELEMKGTRLAKRMLSMVGAVDGFKIETGCVDKLDQLKLQSAAKELDQLKIFIDESTNNTMIDIENKTRQLQEKYPDLGLVVVDHMSIVKSEGGKKNDTRVDEMRKISQGLHSLAKELNVAVLAVAQLNRDSVKGEIRRPKMSDIKESGAIEQDADVIILLFDSLYENNKPALEEKLKNVRVIEAIIAKQRNGRDGVANLIFSRQYSRYDEPSPEFDDQIKKINNQMF